MFVKLLEFIFGVTPASVDYISKDFQSIVTRFNVVEQELRKKAAEFNDSASRQTNSALRHTMAADKAASRASKIAALLD